MLAVHKCCANQKEIRVWMQHFQVKNGNSYATDAHSAIIIPLFEVFGENVIELGEELYFKADEWAKAKMHQSVRISREGLYFTGWDRKNNKIGTCVAYKELPEGRFADVACIFPEKDASTELSRISFSPALLQNVVDALGGIPCHFTFTGVRKAIIVTNEVSKGRGLAMPLFLD